MEKPVLTLVPSAYRTSKVYSVLPVNGDGDFDFSRDSNGTRVQENGLIETKTNNVPRLDWLNSNCPSLLLEPQRTNLVYPNINLSTYAINNGSKFDNVIISPDGENNGSLVQSNGSGTCVVYKSFPTSLNTIYNISVFLKKGNHNNIRLQEGFTNSQMVVDLSNGTKISSGNTTNEKIEDYGNGWYRVSFNYTSSSSTPQAQYSIYINGTTSSGLTFYTFGGQIEQGSYPTSSIKTDGNIATRERDECINAGSSSLFDITEGTIFLDAYIPNNSSTTIISLSNGSDSQKISLNFEAVNSRVRTYSSGGVLYYDTLSYNQRNKILITFKLNEYKTYINGSLVSTDTSATVPTGMFKFNFSQNSGTIFFFEGKVHDTRVYDRVLTEAEAIKLTTI